MRTLTISDPGLLAGTGFPHSIPWHSLYIADSLALAGGSNVTFWPNQGSVGGALTPFSGSAATYRASTAAFSGRPTVETAGVVPLVSSFTTVPQPFTLVVVAQRTGGGASSYFIGGDAAPAAAVFRGVPNTIGFAGTNGPTRPVDDNNNLWIFHANGASSTLEKNGSIATGSAGTNSIDALGVGGRADNLSATRLAGHYALVGLVGRDLTTDERSALRAWAQAHGTP